MERNSLNSLGVYRRSLALRDMSEAVAAYFTQNREILSFPAHCWPMPTSSPKKWNRPHWAAVLPFGWKVFLMWTSWPETSWPIATDWKGMGSKKRNTSISLEKRSASLGCTLKNGGNPSIHKNDWSSLHISSVLTPYLEQGFRNLSQRTVFRCLH